MPRPVLALVVPTVAVLATSCALFCDEDVELSCGGSPYRSSPACAEPLARGCNAAMYYGGVAVALPDLPDGTYLLAAQADGTPSSCPFTVVEGTIGYGTFVCHDWLDFGGRDLALFLEAVPCELTVELRRGDTVIAFGRFRPDYEWDEPWGESCDWRGLAHVELREKTG